MNRPSKEDLITMFWNDRTNNAYLLYLANGYLRELNIPKAIVNTIVNSSTQEFDFTVDSTNREINRLTKYIKNNIRNAENHLCIGGNVAFKPYIKNNRIGIAIYGSRDFYAVYNEFGELSKVYFKTDIRESQYKSYTLVEIHSYDEITREYRIDNYLYDGILTDWTRKRGAVQTMFGGANLPLKTCSQTSYLDDFYIIEDVDRHLCSVVSLDNGMTYTRGISIYDSSIDLIIDAENQYDSLKWEYKGGELAIDANAELLRPAGKNKVGQYELPSGKERLYRKYSGSISSDFDMKVFNPTLRDENYIRGLNEIKRQIEVNCGLYYGALSNVNEVQKTASEVLSSQHRFALLVMNIKNKMKDGIQDTIENAVTIYNRNMPSFLRESVIVNWTIGDSVMNLIVPDSFISENNKNA